MSAQKILIVAALCVAAAAGGYFAQTQFRMHRETAVASGNEAPDIEFQILDGPTTSLHQMRGKLVLVNFWATWCTPCLKEIPMLVKTFKQYEPRGFEIIGPAMDDPGAVRDALPRFGINYPVMSGADDIANAMTALGDNIGALPFSVLIAPNGTIIARKHGPFEEDELDTLIQRNLPAQPAS